MSFRPLNPCLFDNIVLQGLRQIDKPERIPGDLDYQVGVVFRVFLGILVSVSRLMGLNCT